MCDAEEDLPHLFSCHSEVATSTRKQVLYSIKTDLSRILQNFLGGGAHLLEAALNPWETCQALKQPLTQHHFNLR